MVYSICYTSGYMICDLILMLTFKSLRYPSSIVHHIIVLMTFLIGLFCCVGHTCNFYLLGEELSTIPLNLKVIYRNRPHLHHLFSLLFTICFLVSRLIYGSIICGCVLRAALEFFRMTWNFNDMSNFSLGLVQVILCVLTRLLNFYWTHLILKKIIHLKSSNKQRKTS